MKIGPAVRADLPRILAIQKEAYRSEAAIYDDHSLPPLLQTLAEIEAEFAAKVFLKAEVDGVLAGSVRTSLDGTTCQVGRLIVDPKLQRRGLGSALLIAAEAIFPGATRCELFTGAKSVANIGLYERHGYVRFREESPSPAVTLVFMQKQLTPRPRSDSPQK